MERQAEAWAFFFLFGAVWAIFSAVEVGGGGCVETSRGDG
jgi:hypothetical protein